MKPKSKELIDDFGREVYWVWLLEGDGKVAWWCEEEAGSRESDYKIAKLWVTTKVVWIT